MLLVLRGTEPICGQDTVVVTTNNPYDLWYKVLEYRNTVWGMIREDRTNGSDVASPITVWPTRSGERIRSPFDMKERTLLRFWQGHYQELLAEIAAWEHKHDLFGRVPPKFCCYGLPYSPEDSLGQRLLPFMYAHHEDVLARSQASDRMPEEKDFMALYLRYALADIDLKGFDTRDMQQRTAAYLTKYPESPRSRYVRKVLDYRYKPWGMGVGGHLYTGRTNFRGNMAKRFNDTWTIGVDLEIGYGRLLLKSGFGLGFGRPVITPFTYNDTLYQAKSRADLDEGEALLGFAMVDSRKVRLSPFGGVSEFGFGMKGDKGDVTYHGRQVGVDFDLKVDHWDATKNIYTYGSAFMAKQNKGHSSVRLRIAYEQLFNEHDDSLLGGSQLIVRIGYGCYQGAGRRIRTWKHRD